MGKQEQKSQKKGNTAPSHVKRGRVVDRRRNHTINQDVKASAPKWRAAGGGVLVHLKGGNPIRLQGGKFVSVSYQPVQKEEVKWVKVGDVPTPPPTGRLPVEECAEGSKQPSEAAL